MKKVILLFLIISTILTSCASRHVQVDKVDIKKDSVVETKVIVTTIENKINTDSTNINTTTDCSEIIITPIDSSKTIIVDGKSYKNVVLKIKKSKTNTSYTNNKRESNNKRKDSIAVIKAEKTERVVGKSKTIEKSVNYWWLLWLIILILILYLLWRNRLSLLKLL
jgi:ATP-dependent Zn protease